MKTDVNEASVESVVMPPHLPKIIRGCMWDEGWEFDAPCIIYYPFFKYGDGGNTGHLDSMVEDVCIDLSIDEGEPDFIGTMEELEGECEWRGWSMKGFQRRKNAWHVEFRLRWFRKANGDLDFEVTERIEQRGPFRSACELCKSSHVVMSSDGYRCATCGTAASLSVDELFFAPPLVVTEERKSRLVLR